MPSMKPRKSQNPSRRPMRGPRQPGSGEARCFVAIPLPVQVLDSLEAVAIWGQKEASQTSSVRWVTRQQMHLTLAFLGNVPQAKIPGIGDKIAKELQGAMPFALCLKEPGQFPERGRPRVLWWGIGGDEKALEHLDDLAGRVRGAAEACGVLPDKKPFKAHLTLARVRPESRGWIPWPPLKEIMPSHKEFEVRQIVLFQSQLGPGGAKYTVLRQFEIS